MLRQIPGLVGWRYIRVQKDSKRPQGTGWQHPHDQGAAAWESWPGNWGILCGDGDGAGDYLLIIDQDEKHASGMVEYARLMLPATYTKLSISGGAHSLYWAPLDFRPFKRHDLGLEFLGKGQQALAPGSVVDGKEYPDGNGLPIARLSTGDLLSIEGLRHAVRAVDDMDLVEGNRNTALFKRGCAAREVDGLDDDAVLELLQAQNSHMMNPLGDREILTICKSVCKYPAGSPAEPVLPVPDSGNDDWPPNVTRDTWQARLDQLPPRVPLIGPLKSSMVGIMYADAGVGKSMFALHLAHAISKGDGLGEWTGSGRECRVLIIDGEMYSRDIDQRLKMLDGWNMEFQLSEDWPDGGLNLADPLHHPLFYRMAGDARFIIVDNVVSVTAPVDDTLDYFAPQIWMGTAPLRAWARKTNRHILWIDHANRQGKLQGTQAKERDIDYLVKLTRTGELSEALKFNAEFLKYRGDAGMDVIKSEWTLGEYGFGGEIFKDWRALVKTWKRENSHLVGKRGAQAQCAKELGCARQQVNRYW